MLRQTQQKTYIGDVQAQRNQGYDLQVCVGEARIIMLQPRQEVAVAGVELVEEVAPLFGGGEDIGVDAPTASAPSPPSRASTT